MELLVDKKPIDALISVLGDLIPPLKKLFPNLLFLCDAGFTCNRLINFLLSQEIDFVCAISQRRVDEETGHKLRDLWFPKSERFESYYKVRWDIEHEIRTMKGMGLEDYMVRRLRVIRLWILAVWHVRLIRLKAELSGKDFRRFLLSLVMPDVYLRILDLLEFFELPIRRSLRFSSFPDDRLFLFLLKDLIGSYSYSAKV